jgi:hypothetical protein
MTDQYHGRFIAAKVIGREQAALSRTVLINKGSSDGFEKWHAGCRVSGIGRPPGGCVVACIARPFVN